jgi:hypothetical protein
LSNAARIHRFSVVEWLNFELFSNGCHSSSARRSIVFRVRARWITSLPDRVPSGRSSLSREIAQVCSSERCCWDARLAVTDLGGSAETFPRSRTRRRRLWRRRARHGRQFLLLEVPPRLGWTGNVDQRPATAAAVPHRNGNAGRPAPARRHEPASGSRLQSRVGPLPAGHAGSHPVLTVSTAVKLWYCPEATAMRLGFEDQTRYPGRRAQ